MCKFQRFFCKASPKTSLVVESLHQSKVGNSVWTLSQESHVRRPDLTHACLYFLHSTFDFWLDCRILSNFVTTTTHLLSCNPMISFHHWWTWRNQSDFLFCKRGDETPNIFSTIVYTHKPVWSVYIYTSWSKASYNVHLWIEKIICSH